MSCGALLISWCGLVFGINGGNIGCLQTQSSGLVEALFFCNVNSTIQELPQCISKESML